jgi:hypothetical protein
MDGVKGVQAKDAAGLRKAIKDDEEFVLFDGEEPLFRCTPVAQALKSSENHFKYYPHDPAACLYTCWRHPRTPADAPPQEAPEPAPVP